MHSREDALVGASIDSSLGASVRLDSAASQLFKDKSVLVCITGGIAAYKAATIVSALAQAHAKVYVAMTPAACRFIAPLTLQALSANPVFTSPWEHVDAMDPQHISLASRIDGAVVAPCSMDALARLASGRADDIVSLLLSAVDRKVTPVLLAPAMNEIMWSQPSTRRNVQTLHGDGFKFVEPGVGWQACRAIGAGRMAEPEQIIRALASALVQPRTA
jgi:phosphopantothenoylcysteine synthetase/decarboxylase